jgi:hypothetical protein
VSTPPHPFLATQPLRPRSALKRESAASAHRVVFAPSHSPSPPPSTPSGAAASHTPRLDGLTGVNSPYEMERDTPRDLRDVTAVSPRWSGGGGGGNVASPGARGEGRSGGRWMVTSPRVVTSPQLPPTPPVLGISGRLGGWVGGAEEGGAEVVRWLGEIGLDRWREGEGGRACARDRASVCACVRACMLLAAVLYFCMYVPALMYVCICAQVRDEVSSRKDTHTNTKTLSHTQTHTLCLSLSRERALTLTLSVALTRARAHTRRYATSFIEEGWDSLEAVAAMSEAEMLRCANVK